MIFPTIPCLSRKANEHFENGKKQIESVADFIFVGEKKILKYQKTHG
jgi:hypothetical protein